MSVKWSHLQEQKKRSIKEYSLTLVREISIDACKPLGTMKNL
jgi:hypothetical protein